MHVDKVQVQMTGGQLLCLVALADKAKRVDPYTFRHADLSLQMALSTMSERYFMLLSKSWKFSHVAEFKWKLPRNIILAAHVLAQKTDWISQDDANYLLQMTDKFKNQFQL